MRVALISDLHACLEPLDAVLADVARESVDSIVCLGDLTDIGPAPREVIALLRDREVPCIQGNHDDLSGPVLPPVPQNAWCRAQLGEREREFLRDLPSSLSLDLPGSGRLWCVHGSPRRYDDSILSTTSDDRLDGWLGDAADPFTLLACGHTHIQLLRRHRGRLLVNVGSTAAPFVEPYDGHPPRILRWAEYAIVTVDRASLSVDLRRVTYDVDALLASIRASGMPEAETLASSWLPG